MRKRLPDMTAVLFLLIVVGIFYHKTIFGGLLPIPLDSLVGRYHPWIDYYAQEFPRGIPYKNFLITDPVRQQIPWRKEVVQQWASQRSPGWDPTTFSGTPLDLNIQAAAWYPLNILFFLMPFPIAWTLLIMSQTGGLVLFTYIYLRQRKLRPLAAATGAVMAGFSGFSISWLTWGTIVSTLMWLPLLLTALDQFHMDLKPWNKLFWFMLTVGGIFLTLTAGHLQVAFYVLATASLYAAHLAWKKRTWDALFLWTLAGLLLVGLLYRPLWRYWLFLSTTIRGSSATLWQAEGFFIPIKHLIQFMVPDYFGNPGTFNYFGVWNYGELTGYVGIIGLLLALVGMRDLGKTDRFWVTVAGVALVLSVDNPLARLPYYLQVPWLSSLQPTRLLSLVTFGLAVLAAAGAEAMLKETKPDNRLFQRLLAWFGGILLFLLAASRLRLVRLNQTEAAISSRNILLPLAITAAVLVIFLAANRWKRFLNRTVIMTLLLLLLTADLLRFGWKFTPFVARTYFFPETSTITFLKSQTQPFRILAPDLESFPSNTLSFYGMETFGGYNPIYTERYAHFFQAVQNGIVLNDKPQFQRLFDLSNYQSPLLKFSNVKFLITLKPLELNGYRLVHEEGQTRVYEIPTTLPRWYIADQVKTFTDSRSALQAMFDPELRDQPALVETPDPIPVGANADAQMEIVQNTPNNQELTVKTKAESFLVNSTAWDASWRASIDGKDARIFRTNYLFMGVKIPAGSHTVRFDYQR